MSKNAEGWIRHRGGKCPVDKYAHIEYRLRSGQKLSTATGGMLNWGHGKWASDIMAYRLHSPAEQQKPFIEAVQAFNALAKFPRLDGPLKWRDRIAEIDVEVQARTVERAELVQKLASEGFALIGRVVEPVEDMSDWRNWKTGDLLEMVKASDWDAMVNGGLYEMKTPKDGHNFAVINDNGNLKSFSLDRVNNVTIDFKWHSRPSAQQTNGPSLGGPLRSKGT